MNTRGKETRGGTIFCDIDGCLALHTKPCISATPNHKMQLLDGTLEKLEEWDIKGYNLILTTGRKESMRTQTERQLAEAGIMYDALIMGIGGGPRYLINDIKPDNTTKTAYAYNLRRDSEGIKNLPL